jgi:hypothetical protein
VWTWKGVQPYVFLLLLFLLLSWDGSLTIFPGRSQTPGTSDPSHLSLPNSSAGTTGMQCAVSLDGYRYRYRYRYRYIDIDIEGKSLTVCLRHISFSVGREVLYNKHRDSPSPTGPTHWPPTRQAYSTGRWLPWSSLVSTQPRREGLKTKNYAPMILASLKLWCNYLEIEMAGGGGEMS